MIDLIPIYSETRHPLIPFQWSNWAPDMVEKFITQPLKDLIKEPVEDILYEENMIQIRTAPHPDGADNYYMDEFAILKAIIHGLAGFDMDVVSYTVINTNTSYNRNVITIFIHYLLP